MILSVYHWHSQEWTLRNKNIFVMAIARARYFGCPWIIGADFQMSLELFQRHSGTVLDDETTHRPEQGAQSTMDYFIVCGTLKEHIADVVVDLSYGVCPHRAVCITLRTTRQNLLVDEIKNPRVSPAIGPLVAVAHQSSPYGSIRHLGGYGRPRGTPTSRSLGLIMSGSRVRDKSSV